MKALSSLASRSSVLDGTADFVVNLAEMPLVREYGGTGHQEACAQRNNVLASVKGSTARRLYTRDACIILTSAHAARS